MMDLRNEVGHNNMSFQMESEVEHDAQTCDDKAIRNDTPQAKPKVKAQPCKDSDTEKLQRLLFIACAVAFASLLTAFATLVLAVAIMTVQSEVSTCTRTPSAALPCGYNGTKGPAGPFGLPGVQGLRGPSGYNGTQGPPGPGASSCVFKTLLSPGMAASSITRQEITATEPNGKIFIGVNCGTNDAKLAKLSSIISGGKRTYKCNCEGTLTTGESTMYCYMHYWECQS
ncbi:hypothetical protein pdam_00025423 [Pocillopora damicornis]|uniref:Uncharacterized protein n=1 Tax=Pocillopora damicornis TaxID=46731 RepID=A0A3M6UZA2_POCDA|nr:hypothetical protein pdam_00025423 [Pocillopora damicornis]